MHQVFLKCMWLLVSSSCYCWWCWADSELFIACRYFAWMFVTIWFHGRSDFFLLFSLFTSLLFLFIYFLYLDFTSTAERLAFGIYGVHLKLSGTNLLCFLALFSFWFTVFMFARFILFLLLLIWRPMTSIISKNYWLLMNQTTLSLTLIIYFNNMQNLLSYG